MVDKLRKSGIDIIADVPWGTHFCQFYETKEDLIDMLVPYFRVGLENNEFCMWITSGPLGVEDAKKALGSVMPDINTYLDKGQLKILPYTEWYVRDGVFDSGRVLNGWVDKLNSALQSGFDGLRLSGNTFWLEKDDWNDFVDYEEEVDKVIGNYYMIAMCTYCLDKCDAHEIIDVVNNHQFALIKRKDEWTLVESSKQKKIKDELKSTKDKYDSLFNNMLDGYAFCEMIYDNQGNPTDFIYLNVNKAFERITGLNDVVGKKVSEIIPGTKQSHPELFEIYDRVASTGKPERFEIEFKPLNIWLNIAVHSPQKNQFIAIIEDITERKLAEEKVLKAKEDWEHTFDAVPNLIAIVDLDYNICRVNQAMAKRLAVSMEDCIGWKCYELIHGTDDVPLICPHKLMLEDGQEHTLEVYEDKLEGEFINTSSPIYNEKEELTGSVHVLSDITGRKKIEERNRELLEKEQELSEELRTSNEELMQTKMSSEKLLIN